MMVTPIVTTIASPSRRMMYLVMRDRSELRLCSGADYFVKYQSSGFIQPKALAA